MNKDKLFVAICLALSIMCLAFNLVTYIKTKEIIHKNIILPDGETKVVVIPKEIFIKE